MIPRLCRVISVWIHKSDARMFFGYARVSSCSRYSNILYIPLNEFITQNKAASIYILICNVQYIMEVMSVIFLLFF